MLHQGGEKQIDALRANYAAAGVQAELTPFIANTAQAFAEADLVICRAGASTVSEIAAVGAAAIFVPFPSAVDDHQTYNAKFLSKSGGAVLLPQQELTAQNLSKMLLNIEQTMLISCRLNAYSLRKIDATEQVVVACNDLAGKTA